MNDVTRLNEQGELVSNNRPHTIKNDHVQFTGFNGSKQVDLNLDSGEGMGIRGDNTGSVPDKRINGAEIFRAELLQGKIGQTAVIELGQVNAGATIKVTAYLNGKKVADLTPVPVPAVAWQKLTFTNIAFDRLDISSGGSQGFALRGVSFGTMPVATTGGNDIISGGSGFDTVFAGSGSSTIYADFGDIIFAGTAAANASAPSNVDVIYGQTGSHTIQLNPSRNQSDAMVFTHFTPGNGIVGIAAIDNGSRVVGTDEGDTLDFSGVTSWTASRWINGGHGNDYIQPPSGLGGFLLEGGNGDDTIYGSDGDDDIRGGAGNDIIYAVGGNNTIRPGAGDDQVTGGTGDDMFVYGGGDSSVNDKLFGGGGTNTLHNAANNQRTLSSFGPKNNIQVLSGGWRIEGTVGDNAFDFSGVTQWTGMKEVRGGAGEDTFVTSTVHNGQFYDGGADSDTVAIRLTADQLQHLLTSGQFTTLQDYVDSPTGKDRTFDTGNGGSFRVRNFEGATVLLATANGDTLLDLTALPGSFTTSNDFIEFRLLNGSGNKYARYSGETEQMDVDNPSAPFTDPQGDGNLLNISATGGTAYFFGGRLRLGVRGANESGSAMDTINPGESLIFSLGNDSMVANKAWKGVELNLERNSDWSALVTFRLNNEVVGYQIVNGTGEELVSLSPGFDLTFNEIQLEALTGAFGVKGGNAGKFYF